VSGYSIIAAQRAFRKKFIVVPSKSISSQNTMKRWVNNFREKQPMQIINAPLVGQK